MKTDKSLSSNTSSNQDDKKSIDSHGSDTEEYLTSTPTKRVVDKIHKDGSSPEPMPNEPVDSKDSSDSSDDSDENYQIIDETEVREDSLSSSFQNDDVTVKHNTMLKAGSDDSRDWGETIIPAGKRYLINVEVLAASQIVVEFTTSKQVCNNGSGHATTCMDAVLIHS